MAASGTSFQKRSKGKIAQISGTRPSLHNNQLLISTGVPSLDNVVGGGLAVGTVIIIEEDAYGSYSKMLLKYYLAEGVMNKHELLVASADIDPQQIIDELPGPLIDDPGADIPQSTDNSENMKIAFRYQHLGQAQSSPSGRKFGHYYDLTKTMDKDIIGTTQLTVMEPAKEEDCLSSPSNKSVMNPCYMKLLQKIQRKIVDGKYGTSTNVQQRNILRIGVHSLGSPQWGEESPPHGKPDPSLGRFLYALRALMRTSYATCLITVPTHLYQDSCLVGRIQHLGDMVVGLESFVGSDKEKNPAFKEYHGLFHIIKLPRLNSLTCNMPDTMDLAFKLRKKKFMIEMLHLPPELSDTASRPQEDPVLPRGGAVSCGSGARVNKLDF